jgi:hypothetical protein
MTQKNKKARPAIYRGRAFLFPGEKKSAIAPFQPFDTARINPK